MTIQNGDRIYFPAGVTRVTAYQTAQDAVDEIDRTGQWRTRDNDVPLYVRRLFSSRNGTMIELSSPDKASVVWAIGYALSSTGPAVGFLDMSELDRAAMVANSGSGDSGSGSVNFDNILFSFSRSVVLGGEGVRINPQLMPREYVIDFTIHYTNSSGKRIEVANHQSIGSLTYVTINDIYYGDIIKEMGSSNTLGATGVATLYDPQDRAIDTKTWGVTIYRGEVGSPESINTTSPIKVTLVKGGPYNTLYPGISTLVINFAYVEPGYGELTYLRLTDSGFGWNLLHRNTNKTGINTFTGTTSGLPSRWYEAPVTLQFIARNSANQETVIDSNAITFTVKDYGGMGISSFISTSRTDTAVALEGNGNFDSSVTEIPRYTLDLINSSGDIVDTKSIASATLNGDNKWKFSHTFSGIEPDASYSIRLTLTDDMGMQASQTINIGGSAVPLSLGRYGAGVGVMVDDELRYDLQVGTNGVYSLGPIYSQGSPVLTGGSDMWQALTQSEYNALTTAQKNDPSKIYLIKI